MGEPMVHRCLVVLRDYARKWIINWLGVVVDSAHGHERLAQI